MNQEDTVYLTIESTGFWYVAVLHGGHKYAMAGIPTREAAEEIGKNTLFVVSEIGHEAYEDALERGVAATAFPHIPPAASLRYPVEETELPV